MHHAPLERHLRDQWEDAVALLQSRTVADYGVLRRIDGQSSEVIACHPTPVPEALGDAREGLTERFAGHVLAQGTRLCIADARAEARWDAVRERRGGVQAYWGEPLYWPDQEAFGCLELLALQPATPADAESTAALLACIATGIRAQLETLYLRKSQAEGELTDELTGLATERLFREFADQQLKLKARDSGNPWMLVWSIDAFDAVRAELGANESDLLLRACAERVRSCVRQSDVLARLGENLFAMLISDANEYAVNAIADRIRRNVHRVKDPRGESLTLSCGLCAALGNDTLQQWRGRCEEALSQARDGGGNQVTLLRNDV